MKDLRRAIVAAILIAIAVAIVAWASAPSEGVVPPTIVPVMGERPATVVPAAVDVAPNGTICGQVPCAVP